MSEIEKAKQLLASKIAEMLMEFEAKWGYIPRLTITVNEVQFVAAPSSLRVHVDLWGPPLHPPEQPATPYP